MDGPRACRESEFDEVIALINQTFRAGMDQDIRTDYPLVFNHSKLEYMRILRVDGKAVSHVPVAPRRVIANDDAFTIGIISPTVTHPDYRKRGYATLCLRDCVRIMGEEGWPVSVLWTVEATFPFYQQAGWEAVGSQGWVYTLRPSEHELFEEGQFDIVPYDPSDEGQLDTILQIHDAEPFRVARSRTDYQALLSLPKIHAFLAVGEQRQTSYLVLGESVNKPGFIEGGGDPKGLEALVGRLLRDRISEDVQVWASLTPSALGTLMETKKPSTGRPVEEGKGAGYQMMRVNSLEKLLRGIRHHLNEKAAELEGTICLVCKETDECVSLAFGNGTVELSSERRTEPIVLSRRQLAQLIFGGYAALEPLQLSAKAGAILERIFPYYFPVWGLDHS